MLRDFILKIPKNNIELYTEYILHNIYELKDFKYKGEDENYYIIIFNTDDQIPLMNSLPLTIKKDINKIYYSNKKILETIKLKILQAIKLFSYDINNGIIPIQYGKIILNRDELNLIIKQLALIDFINKYYQISKDCYLIFVNIKLAIIIKLRNSVLEILIYDESVGCPFDIDDGYTGLLSCMNDNFNLWINNNNITKSIHPPNYV